MRSSLEVKALSVRAPWAGMIADGRKTLEIRSRRTHYRGELLICESRGGGAVAVVELVGCRPFAATDDAASGGVWATHPEARAHYAWELRLVRRVTSAAIKGRLGFYDVAGDSFRSAGA
jgi:ASCH domain-containing protein